MERHKGRDCERSLYSHTLPVPHKAGAFFGAPFYIIQIQAQRDRVTQPRSYSKQMAQAGLQPRHDSHVLADGTLDTRRMLDAKMDKDVGKEES